MVGYRSVSRLKFGHYKQWGSQTSRIFLNELKNVSMTYGTRLVSIIPLPYWRLESVFFGYVQTKNSLMGCFIPLDGHSSLLFPNDNYKKQ